MICKIIGHKYTPNIQTITRTSNGDGTNNMNEEIKSYFGVVCTRCGDLKCPEFNEEIQDA